MKKGNGAGSAKQGNKAAAEHPASKQPLLDGQTVSDAELLGVLDAAAFCTNLFGKGCKCRKDSPNCLAGLIPAPGANRRKGLWAKEPDSLANLGPDPAEDEREDVELPVGLTNLGNTCYVNSVLQCLCMNAAFRRGVFALEDAVAQQAILAQLRRLFAELVGGPRTAADPSAFSAALKLDNAVQQDGQEFLTLLLTVVEKQLAASAQPVLKELVPTLFRGGSVWETTCQVCKCKSEGSSRVTDFYELDVPVLGHATLADSLRSMLAVEHLRGDNRFLCGHCGVKTDAARRLRLRTLPPYLSIALQRFVFDPETMAKTKLSQKFSFPLELQLDAMLADESAAHTQGGQSGPGHPACAAEAGEQPAADLQYELVGILIHKGGLASEGHYVAHLRDESTGAWFRFDDEEVHPMEQGPASEPHDHGVSSTSISPDKAAASKKGKKRKTADDDDADAAADAGPSPVRSKRGKATLAAAAAPAAHITSTNAYMLMYRRRGWQAPSLLDGSAPLPNSVHQMIDSDCAAYRESCATYKEAHDSINARFEERQALVRAVLKAAPVPSARTAVRLVSATWLRQWADSEEDTGPLDNSSLLCPHGKLNPDATDMKCVTLEAWQQLVASAGGGQELAPSDLCRTCHNATLQAAATEQELARDRGQVLAELDALPEDAPAGAGDYLVSQGWLSAWRKRSGRTMGAVSPTEGITCRHGGLAEEGAAARTRRRAVPPGVWAHLQRAWAWEQQDGAASGSDGEAQDHQGGAGGARSGVLVSFPAATTSTCQSCLQDQAFKAKAGQRANTERAALRQLASSATTLLEPGTLYRVLPRSWLEAWQAFVGGGGAAPPPPLAEAMDGLLCSCHTGAERGLTESLPSVTERRGKWAVEDDADTSSALVDSGTWKTLQELYQADKCREFTAFVNAIRGCLVSSPPVCPEANSRRQQDQAAVPAYCDAQVTVEVVPDLEFLSRQPGASAAGAVNQRPKRARHNRAALTVSSAEHVFDLRVKVYNALGVHPDNAVIFAGGTRLADDSATLAAAGVRAGEELRVVDAAKAEPDVLLALAELGGAVCPRREVERGFAGTALTGATPPGALPPMRPGSPSAPSAAVDTSWAGAASEPADPSAAAANHPTGQATAVGARQPLAAMNGDKQGAPARGATQPGRGRKPRTTATGLANAVAS